MVGCVEVFAQEGIRSIAELKGKRVGVRGVSDHGLLSVMIAHVGLDPAKDIEWINDPNPVKAFRDGKIDAFLGFPPEPQELRARQIGHVIVNNAVDRPWSQYFCCMLGGNREFVRNNPVATKRALRAILKGDGPLRAEPERAARRLVDGGFTPRYDYALQTLRENVLRQMARVRPRGHGPASMRCACTKPA